MREGILIWITGISGVGKSTVGEILYKEFRKIHPNTVWLDGDVLRDIYNIQDGYDEKSRHSLAYSYSKLCELFVKQGLIVICTTISMFEDVRRRNRNSNEKYVEVFLEAAMGSLVLRNCKNIYSSFQSGIVGIDIVPEFPQNPDLIFRTDLGLTANNIAKEIGHKVEEMYDI